MTEKKTITFFAECVPPTATAQQRKFFAKGKNALSPKAKIAAATWKAVVEPFAPTCPIAGPLAVEIAITWPGVGQAVPRIAKPDLDNAAKLLLDAMTKTGFWHDDAQIVELVLAKFDGEISGVFVSVEARS